MPGKEALDTLNFEELQVKASDAALKIPEDNHRPREWSQIVKELESRTEAPTHKELMDGYEGGDSKLRFDIAEKVAINALERAGVKTLDQAHRIEEDIAIFGGSEKGKPDVHYKQILDKNGRKTDQVLMVILLNESNNPDENTVVTMVVKQTLGSPLIGKDQSGHEYPAQHFHLTSQTGYENIVAGLPESSDKQAPPQSFINYTKGLRTREEYLREVQNENLGAGGLDGLWKRWNAERANDPEYWKSNRVSTELMHKLEGDYQKELQDFQVATNAVVERTQAALEAKLAAQEQALKTFNTDWGLYILSLKEKKVRVAESKLGFEKQEYTVLLSALAAEARRRGVIFENPEDLLDLQP